jgi:CubicO group peptidase (beta-lactamase class C family)
MRNYYFLRCGAAIGAAAVFFLPQPVQAEPPQGDPTPAAIDTYLREALGSTGLPGISAVVTHGDRVVHATGLGRDSSGRPVTGHTPMRVASVSKSFTAAAVLTLVDDGRVRLDESVSTYLPEFRMADPRAGEVTVRQLLNQTSGLSDTTVDIGATQRAATLADYVAALRPGTLAAEPGTHWEYCNVNYEVAARLVEVVVGVGFGEFMRQRVFGPLRMGNSAVGDRIVRPADRFISIYGAWVPRAELPAFRGGAGGVVTTAADMGQWLISQTGHGTRVLTPRSLEIMHAPSAVSDYGMGWGAQTVNGRTLLVHSGNQFTYTAVEAIDPATGFGFAVMTNSASLRDDTYDVLLGLVALSDGQTPAVPGGELQITELGCLAPELAGRQGRRRVLG